MITKDQFQKNLDTLQNSIHPYKNITIIAVTKKQPVEAYQLCKSFGISHIAENRVQEYRDKINSNPQIIKEFFNHFIGSLQSRKIKMLPNNIYSIDSLDSLQHARKLENHFQKQSHKIHVLIQINPTNNTNKNGIFYKDQEYIQEIAIFIEKSSILQLDGLMAMSENPQNFIDSKEHIRKTMKDFAIVRKLQEKISQSIERKLHRLSLGMSNDYKIALEEGATEIRIGSLLFRQNV